MTEVEIILDRKVFYPGDVISGKVIFNPNKKIKFDELHIEIDGLISNRFSINRGKHKHVYSEKETIIHDKIVFDTKGILSQQRVYEFTFKLPNNAIPFYDGYHSNVQYKLTARIVIPFWFDKVFSRRFFVLPPPAIPKIDLFKFSFPNVNDTSKPYVELVLPTVDFYPGAQIPIAFMLHNIKKYRGVRIEVIVKETAYARGRSRTIDYKKFIFKVKKDEIDPFGWNKTIITIPKAVPFSINHRILKLRWYLKFVVDIPLKFDIEHTYEILMIMPRDSYDNKLQEIMASSNFDFSESTLPPEVPAETQASSMPSKTPATTPQASSDISQVAASSTSSYADSLFETKFNYQTSFEAEDPSQMQSSEISEPTEISDEYRELHEEFEPLRYYGILKYLPSENKFDRVILTPSFGNIKSIVIDILQDEYHFKVEGTRSTGVSFTASIVGRVTAKDNDIITADKILESLRISSNNKEFKKALESNIELGYALADVQGPFSIYVTVKNENFVIEVSVMRKTNNVREAFDVIKAMAWIIDTFY